MSLLRVNHLKKLFPIKGGLLHRAVAQIHAVDDVTFEIDRGETVGLVGESGCGKSTLGRCILRLLEPSSGQILYKGVDVAGMDKRGLWRRMQMVFQDPMSSLNPRLTVGYIVGEPLKVRGMKKADVKTKAVELLTEVGLNPEHYDRYPHEFSGGQRQRIMIARALITNPEFVVLDEPTSSLDVSVQAKTLNLLNALKRRLDITYLFVSHDLSIINHMSDRILVMYVGTIVEMATKRDLFKDTLHPYTQLLMNSIPMPKSRTGESRFVSLEAAEIPSNIDIPKGCRFEARCPQAMDICRESQPDLIEVKPRHFVACYLYR